jgi:hypothetical protein
VLVPTFEPALRAAGLQEDEGLQQQQQMEGPGSEEEEEEAEAMEEDGRMPGTDLALYGAGSGDGAGDQWRPACCTCA